MSRLKREPFSYRSDPAVPPFPDDHPIIVFDGYCALCSGYARFVLAHDHAGVFRLVAAQSSLGHALYVHYGLDPQDFETNILIADGKAYFKSEASIRIAEQLGPPWSVARALRLVPIPIRDQIYAFIARNRLRLFGKLETCYVPGAQFRNRVLPGSSH
jgi:predicted DCC family thiol-disulfide oxidoreductase YuxK